jgi:hypothetical protein
MQRGRYHGVTDAFKCGFAHLQHGWVELVNPSMPAIGPIQLNVVTTKTVLRNLSLSSLDKGNLLQLCIVWAVAQAEVPEEREGFWCPILTVRQAPLRIFLGFLHSPPISPGYHLHLQPVAKGNDQQTSAGLPAGAREPRTPRGDRIGSWHPRAAPTRGNRDGRALKAGAILASRRRRRLVTRR